MIKGLFIFDLAGYSFRVLFAAMVGCVILFDLVVDCFFFLFLLLMFSGDGILRCVRLQYVWE